MSTRWQRFICRLRGHDSYGFTPWGGYPHSALFGIRSTCRRCSADTSVVLPSRFTIINDRASRAGLLAAEQPEDGEQR